MRLCSKIFKYQVWVGLLEQMLPQGAEDEEEGPYCLGEEGGVPHMVGQDDQVEMVRLVRLVGVGGRL